MTNFREVHPVAPELSMRTGRQTDMTKLAVAFRNSAKSA